MHWSLLILVGGLQPMTRLPLESKGTWGGGASTTKRLFYSRKLGEGG